MCWTATDFCANFFCLSTTINTYLEAQRVKWIFSRYDAFEKWVVNAELEKCCNLRQLRRNEPRQRHNANKLCALPIVQVFIPPNCTSHQWKKISCCGFSVVHFFVNDLTDVQRYSSLALGWASCAFLKIGNVAKTVPNQDVAIYGSMYRNLPVATCGAFKFEIR